MPGVDWIPGVSQVKSICQLVTGDTEGAAKTQENFLKECPVVSQGTSVVQLIAGDTEGAKETQKLCLGTINNVANGIPVVGHIKGGVHHAFGDHDGGNQALLAATRSTVVIGSGVAAGIASGGFAAIPAGIAAGGAFDFADSAISDKPKGVYAAIHNAVENPNAGNIFDAAAVFAGDGLAGYSGGQIGKQISTQVKLNSLEAARAAKTDQLNAALFPEKGAVSSMTTGQLTSLGKQINALTSEISTIRHGTPQYWLDPKSNQVVVTKPGGVNVVFLNPPVDGETTDQYNRDVVPNDHNPIHVKPGREENALLADIYYDEIEIALSPEEREMIFKRNVEQKPQSETVKEVYSNSRVITYQEWERLSDNVGQDNDPSRNLTTQVELLIQRMWLHVKMPAKFNYTGAILTNHIFQGLFHTFIRHWDQWQQYIPDLDDMMNEIPENIREYINKVRNATDKTESRKAQNELNKAIKNMDHESYVDYLLAIHKIQMKIYKALNRNITNGVYLGEGVNNSKQVQVYFKVTDSTGNTEVMVVGLSEQLFPSMDELGDTRPVRTIITVYFITEEEYKNLDFRTGKAFK